MGSMWKSEGFIHPVKGTHVYKISVTNILT